MEREKQRQTGREKETETQKSTLHWSGKMCYLFLTRIVCQTQGILLSPTSVLFHPSTALLLIIREEM